MCGIVGIVSKGRDVASDLVQGIRRLEYRGYDSCGVALPNGSKLSVTKDVGGPTALLGKGTFDGLSGTLGIAHTRWATHGGVSRNNAHPHLARDGRVALVHNGVLDNYRELRERMQTQGLEFDSETDSEVALRLLEVELAAGRPPREAVLSMARQLKGTYAIVIMMWDHPDRLWALRQESPLLVGLADDAVTLASDPMALGHDCHSVMYPEDGDLVEVSASDVEVFSIQTGEPVHRDRHVPQGVVDDPELCGFENYMEKEMCEVPTAVRAALDVDPAVVAEAAHRIVSAERVFLCGMGTAYHMALFGHSLMATWGRRFCPVVTADELPDVVEFTERDLVVGISQSGETYDTLRALRTAKAAGAGTVAICNAPASSMAREVDRVVLQNAGPEVAVLATKSAVSQATLLSRVALEVARITGGLDAQELQFQASILENLPQLLEEWRPRVDQQSREVSARFLGLEKWFFLGRGLFASVAMEGALKFKEVTYRHAEGMAAGFLKHGTISLIDAEMGTALFLPPARSGSLRSLSITALEEVRSRGGPVLVVGSLSDSDRELADASIETPNESLLGDALVQILAGQYLSYHTARALGRDVDKPRALAKSVTVP